MGASGSEPGEGKDGAADDEQCQGCRFRSGAGQDPKRKVLVRQWEPGAVVRSRDGAGVAPERVDGAEVLRTENGKGAGGMGPGPAGVEVRHAEPVGGASL